MTVSRPTATAGVALLGLAALLAIVDRGDARPEGAPGAPPAANAAAPAWAGAVEAGADHLDALDLVARLRADRSRVLLVDVRPPEEFARFHLKDSHNLSLPALLGPEGAALLDAHPGATVVLLSNGMTHPGQAWTELARRGRTNVFLLEDGLDGLRSGLLAPPALRGAMTEEAARRAAAAHADAREVLLGAR